MIANVRGQTCRKFTKYFHIAVSPGIV